MPKYLFILLLFLITSCTPFPAYLVTCDDIIGTKIQPFLFEQIELDDLKANLAQAFRLPKEAIMADAAGNSSVIRWTKDGILYSLSTEGLEPVDVSVNFSQSQPSAEQVVKCLGAPTHYSANYALSPAGKELVLSLLFADKGILVTGGKDFSYTEQNPPVPNGSIPIGTIRIVEPGTSDQVLRMIYSPDYLDQNKNILNEYKPWPGSWEKLSVDSDASFRSH